MHSRSNLATLAIVLNAIALLGEVIAFAVGADVPIMGPEAQHQAPLILWTTRISAVLGLVSFAAGLVLGLLAAFLDSGKSGRFLGVAASGVTFVLAVVVFVVFLVAGHP